MYFYSTKSNMSIILYNFASNLNKFENMSNLNRIKAVLAEQNKTGKWLAEKLGKSSCTVSKWCSNSNQPDLQTLEKIAQLLDVDKRDLLTPTKNN